MKSNSHNFWKNVLRFGFKLPARHIFGGFRINTPWKASIVFPVQRFSSISEFFMNIFAFPFDFGWSLLADAFSFFTFSIEFEKQSIQTQLEEFRLKILAFENARWFFDQYIISQSNFSLNSGNKILKWKKL